MNLAQWPQTFLDRMKYLFDQAGRADEYEMFMSALAADETRGIRMNGLKIAAVETFKKLMGNMQRDFGINYDMRRIPWSDDGYYLPGEIHPGRHPYHKAGLFYLQEPSAMLPAYVLSAMPEDKVLDLCAAPGGKTVKIAADMKRKGILISNDINRERVKALRRNVENAGCTNCIVSNESPSRLADRLSGYFDKILVDAPCSGEGMLRKDPSAIRSWEKFGPVSCAKVQRDILHQADRMLRGGGMIVYSTCTFSIEENEEIIERFIAEHPYYRVVIPDRVKSVLRTGLLVKGFFPGETSSNTLRIFPHRALGEGHFCAMLKKNYSPESVPGYHETQIETTKSGEIGKKMFQDAFRRFSKDLIDQDAVDEYLDTTGSHVQIYQGHVYTLPQQPPLLDGLNLTLKGHYAGYLRSVRGDIQFEPSQALALSLPPAAFMHVLSWPATDSKIKKYLKGETLTIQEEDFHGVLIQGFVPIATDGYVLGWGKVMKGNMIKNLYPPGWVDRMIL
jgi:NOL1/NOP2/sun family putative RNA methylase